METSKTLFPQENIESLRQYLSTAKNIVIFPHTAPDGDALGSTIAFAKVVERVNPSASVHVVSPDPIERYLQWIPFADELCIYIKEPARACRLINESDLICHLDHNQTSRLRHPELVNLVSQSSAKRVMIDHHLYPEEGFDLLFSYPPYSSTCELVLAILEALSWLEDYCTPEVATLLALGIITDTGRFMYSCFSPYLYERFATLIAKGADYPRIIDQLSYHGSLKELLLKGYVLHEKLEVYEDLGAAVISLSQEEMQARDLSKGDTEGLVNLPLSVEGIDCVCFIREDKTQVKISLRSIGSFPVNIIAQEAFGGGGHLNAAGGEWQGSLDGAKQEFLAHLRTLRSKHQG